MDEKKNALTKFRCVGRLNKGPEVEMQVDTGCCRTTVRKDLLPNVLLKPGRSEMTVANGNKRKYSLADVILTVKDQEYPLEVAVAEKLAVPVLLGVDLPLEDLWIDNVSTDKLEKAYKKRKEGLVAMVTRSQTRKQTGVEGPLHQSNVPSEKVEDIGGEVNGSASMREARQCNDRDEGFGFAKDLFQVEHAEMEDTEEEETNPEFDNELFLPDKDPQPGITQLPELDGLVTCGAKGLEPKPKSFGQIQELDGEIKKWMKEEDSERIVRREGILFRKWRTRDESRPEVHQLVLPKGYQKEGLKLAHSIPIAGHLGREKTLKRILSRFYWPAVQLNVRKYCRECPECQLSSKEEDLGFR